MLVVADASPLVVMARVGLLDLLPALFERVLVPRVVWLELVEGSPNAVGVAELRAAPWLHVALQPSPPVMDLGLDAGETAAIALAEAESADLLLMDERAGRAVARARGLPVRGTLGVLLEARQRGLIEALAPVLARVEAEGFRLHPALIARALAEVGEARDAP
jgi:predicted nucleic acid-binding protein